MMLWMWWTNQKHKHPGILLLIVMGDRVPLTRFLLRFLPAVLCDLVVHGRRSLSVVWHTWNRCVQRANDAGIEGVSPILWRCVFPYERRNKVPCHNFEVALYLW